MDAYRTRADETRIRRVSKRDTVVFTCTRTIRETRIKLTPGKFCHLKFNFGIDNTYNNT